MMGGGPMGMMGAPNAGEILLNRAESAALAALETEEDPEHGLRRAQAESGLDRQQLLKLQRRATHASSKGYTLKGPNFTKKPLASSPDEPGLARKATKGDEAETGLNAEQKAKQKEKAKADKEKAAKATATKTTTTVTAKAKETTASLVRTVQGGDLYVVPGDRYGYPAPASDGLGEACEDDAQRETNSMTTMAAMLARNRRKRRLD